MQEEEIFSKIQALIVEQFGEDESIITMDTAFKDDLSADSIDLVEIVMELEEAYEINAEAEELSNIVTVGDAVHMVMNKLDA